MKLAQARVQKYVNEMGEVVSIDLPHFVDDGMELAGEHTVSGLGKMAASVKASLGGVLGNVKEVFTGGDGFSGIMDRLFGGGGVINNVKGWASKVTGIFGGGGGGGIMGMVSGLFGGGGGITKLLGAAGPWGAGIAAALKYKDQIVGVFRGVGSAARSVFSGIRSAISGIGVGHIRDIRRRRGFGHAQEAASTP